MFNKTIKNRIENFLNTQNIIPFNSFGFRKQKSCHQCINSILNNILKNTAEKKYTLLIITDISKAFDNVNLNKLIEVLIKIKLNPIYINLIIQFLNNRKVLIQNSKNEYYDESVQNGLPQGSILSALLFNIYTHELHKLSTHNTQIYQYADDFSIYSHLIR